MKVASILPLLTPKKDKRQQIKDERQQLADE